MRVKMHRKKGRDQSMADWITTHWPHPDLDPDPLPWFIYLKKKSRGKTVAIKDRVLFYGTKSCAVTHIQREDGVCSETIRLSKGIGGIVGLATVIKTVEDVPAEQVRFNYGDGAPWPYQIRCSPIEKAARYVSYRDMLAILKLPETKRATGFGLYRVKDESRFEGLLRAAGLG
jgi:hypothetical protein